MARKSRKHPHIDFITKPCRDTVGYICLSVRNTDPTGSIENQKLIIEEWGCQHQTLEEAMLAKRYQVTVLEKQTQNVWKKRRKDDALEFVVPRGAECNIRSIVSHTSETKTDFMYSVILGNLSETMLPNYIKEALLWLMQ